MSATRREVIAGSTAMVGLSACGGLPPAMASALPAVARSGRDVLSLNDGWRFHEGDIAFPPIRDHEAAYANGKAGNATGAAAADYDDADWAIVTVPHDWALGQPFDRSVNIDQGFRRRGIGWYRRTFALEDADRERHLELRFDGIATHATVWINGTLAHRNFSGFNGFTIDFGAFARFGDDLNTVAIRVDADATEGWWYEGAGIYRHCWLARRAPVHIATDGVHCAPRHDGLHWRVPVAATIVNTRRTPAPIVLEAILTDPSGHRVTVTVPVDVPAEGTMVAHATLPCLDPIRWSPDAPTLYTLTMRILERGRSLDAVETPIGFRTLRFDARDGFFLNERPLKIRGVCVHQDHAGVGVAVPDSLWEYRLRRLKAMGANAIRCAHNPPASALLDAADRLGMLVMDEYRELSGADDTLDRLGWLIRRDRNHPSVILWSLCNEESLQSSETGVAMIRRMKSVVRALDDDRPITAALNGAMFARPNIADELDVVGFNYGTAQYDRYHATFPDRPLLSSEDTSAYMTRGVLRTDRAAHILADDNSEHAAWGLSHGEAWRSIATRPFMAGGFAWTGFDYRGEPTPFEWPSVGASFGAMDLCGFAKSAFHIRRALWSGDEPVLELSPHWTWPSQEGAPIPILVISNADRVVLRLNGRIVAELAVDPFTMARTEIAYRPGRLEAIAYRAGRPVAHRSIETAGRPIALRLTPDRRSMLADGRDTMPITVEAVDARGRACPGAGHRVELRSVGGTIAGVGNGDPNSHESDLPAPGGRTATRQLFNGLAQALVQARGGYQLTITAQADDLASASLTIDLMPAFTPSIAPRNSRQSLTEWRQAPPSSVLPQLDRTIADDDMNSWAWIKPGSVEIGGTGGRYVLFQTVFTPRRRTIAAGGDIIFARIAGLAQIRLDGQLVHTKANPGPGRLVVPLTAGPGPRTLQILFDTGNRPTPFGLPGSVTVG